MDQVGDDMRPNKEVVGQGQDLYGGWWELVGSEGKPSQEVTGNG